jgi:hypothetical protein
MNLNRVIAVLGLIAFIASPASAKTLGIWNDSRSYIKPALTNMLIKAGWDIEIFEHRGRLGNDLEDAEKLAKTDVLLFVGGWNSYFFPTPKSRLNLIRYVASGKGVLLSGFRSGYVRTANRPMFPSIGCTYNRLSSPWIGPMGNNFLARLFDGKMIPSSGSDHLAIKVGESGTPFCASSKDVVGVYGEYFSGRVIVFGGHFMFSDEMSDAEKVLKKILLKSLDYLSGGKKLSKEDAAFVLREAESEFLQREILLSWTLDDRGPDRRPGVIPEVRDSVLSKPEALAFQLDYLLSYFPPRTKMKSHDISSTLKRYAKVVRNRADEMIERAKKKLQSYSTAELALEYVSGEGPFSKSQIEKLLKGCVRESDVVQAESHIAELTKEVQEIKKAKLRKEIEEDLEKIPSLVKMLGDGEKRYEAVLEIGRIAPEDESVHAEVIKRLSDSDEKVRTQAIITLGWLRAKSAVEPLAKLLSSEDKFDKNRAIQSLGHIGEKGAIKYLVKVLADKSESIRARSLAAIALGHLKAKEALPILSEIAEDESLSKWDVKALRVSSIQALGNIGDKSSRPMLQKLHEKAKDLPKDRRGVRNAPNYLSHKDPMGVYVATLLALKAIDEGGRKTLGVVQREELRSYDEFYAIKKKHNAFVGRTETVMGAFSGVNQKYLWPYAKKAGFTGVHNAWGWCMGWTPEDFKEVVRKAGESGLIWIDVMPGWACSDAPSCEMLFSEFDDIPAFRGLWAEETWPDTAGDPKGFNEFVEKKYGKNWKKDLDLSVEELKAVENLPSWVGFGMKGPNKKLEEGFRPPWDGTLRTLCLEYAGKTLEEAWRESQDYMSSRRKGFSHTYVISTADPTKVLGGIKAAHRLDSLGHESYESFGRGSAYFMERYRNAGSPRSVMTEQYNWYCPSIDHAVRGFWQNAIHSKCYYNFALHQIFNQPSWYDNWSWQKGRWEKAVEVFSRVAKTPEHYDISPSASNVGVIFSERSSVVTKEQVYFQTAVPVRTDQGTMASFVALNKLNLPTDVIWAETLSDKLLSKYKFIYLPTSRFLTDDEVASLRTFVKNGGVLFAEGGSSLYHPMKLDNRGNYKLADVFGCNWKKTVYREGDSSDTYACRHGSQVSAYKVVANDNKVNLDDSIHRDLKPQKSIVEVTLLESFGSLGRGAKIEIDGALGIDLVEPTSAKVLAKYNSFNGEGAVFVNDFGDGRCYFISANNFSLAHTTSEWEMMPNKFDFWGNVKELIGSALKDGFGHTGAELPIEIEGVSEEVEVSVADFKDRHVVHLLDYDTASKGVSSASAVIPGARKIRRVYYPFNSRRNLPIEGRRVALRDFEVYDMFVIEYE